VRLFTALNPPPEVRDACTELQEALSLPTARWSSPGQLHITIRFLGDTEPERAQQYEAALSEIHTTAAHCKPYGLDVLPSRRSPRVIVLGFKRTDSLLALHTAVSEALETAGLAPEDRTYRPHLTLARLDDPDPEHVHNSLETCAAPLPDPFWADTMHLYESTLTADGAVHEQRASFGLAAPAP
jgi:2'-5' RNA ligase